MVRRYEEEQGLAGSHLNRRPVEAEYSSRRARHASECGLATLSVDNWPTLG